MDPIFYQTKTSIPLSFNEFLIAYNKAKFCTAIFFLTPPFPSPYYNSFNNASDDLVFKCGDMIDHALMNKDSDVYDDKCIYLENGTGGLFLTRICNITYVEEGAFKWFSFDFAFKDDLFPKHKALLDLYDATQITYSKITIYLENENNEST